MTGTHVIALREVDSLNSAVQGTYPCSPSREEHRDTEQYGDDYFKLSVCNEGFAFCDIAGNGDITLVGFFFYCSGAFFFIFFSPPVVPETYVFLRIDFRDTRFGNDFSVARMYSSKYFIT